MTIATQRHTVHYLPKVDPRRLGIFGSLALYARSDTGVVRASATNVQDWVDQSRKAYTFEGAVYENKYGTNLGFETALGAEWVETKTATGTTARDATVAKYGVASLKLVMTGSTAAAEVVEMAQTFLDIDAAEVWSYQIWIRIDALTNCKVVLFVDYTGGAPDVSAESTTVDGTKFVVLTLSNQTAPAGTTAAVVRIRLEATAADATGTVYVDGVMVVLSASLPNIYSQGQSIKNSFDQRTTSQQPVVTPAVFRGKPGISFATDDLLRSILGPYLVGSSGMIMGFFRFTVLAAANAALFSSSDEATDTSVLNFVARNTDADPTITFFQRNAGDVSDALTAINQTQLVAAVTYLHIWRSDGTTYSARVNGRPQPLTVAAGANTGDWFGDTTLRDNVVIGAWKRTTEVQFISARVALILGWDTDPGMGARMLQLERIIRQRGLRGLR